MTVAYPFYGQLIALFSNCVNSVTLKVQCIRYLTVKHHPQVVKYWGFGEVTGTELPTQYVTIWRPMKPKALVFDDRVSLNPTITY